jgi:outer membrane receptor protein involved in Fe transport
MSRYLPLLLISVRLGACLASAQVTTGTISGIVQDQSGAAIAGAEVTVKNVDTGTARTLTSDAGGRYTAPDLPLGNYEVQAQHSGFQTEVRSGINITVGREAVVNLGLRVGQLSEKVTITGEAPLVESTSSALSSLVDDRTIRDLPLNGRSYDQLALTQPGVVSMGAGLAGAAFDYGTGVRFSVAGSRSYANSFVLDGTDINDHANGTPGGAAGTNLGVDGILEFKINTAVSPAEYGRSSGGVISAVTRSGTNSVHGSAFLFKRNNHLDSLGYFDQVANGGTGDTAPYRQSQFGGSVGGPIKKDRTFYFGTYEGLRRGVGGNIVADVPTAATLQGTLPYNAFQGTDPGSYCAPSAKSNPSALLCNVPVSSAVKPYLSLYPAPSPGPKANLGDGTGWYFAAPVTVTQENYFMTRVDHQISDKTRVFFRYSFDKDSNVLPDFAGGSVADEHDQSRRQYATIQLNQILQPTLVNSLRVSFNRTYQNFDDLVSNPAAANLGFIPGKPFGTISFGSQGLNGQTGSGPLNVLGIDNGAPRIYTYNNFQEGDDLTWVKGPHSIKMGVDVKRIQDNETTESNGRGDYTFLDIPAFFLNTPIRFDAPPPGQSGYRGIRETMFGAYVQDDFKVNQRLTLNLGLRYEFITDPTEVNGKMANLLHISDPTTTVEKDHFVSVSKKDFQPRVGFAWQADASGKTVVRGGFGIFHDHILPFSFVANASGTPPFFSTLSDLTNPVFPLDTNLTNGAPPPPQFNPLPASVKEPSKIQYNLNLQREIIKNTVLEVAYIGSESHHLQYAYEENPTVQISPGVFAKPLQRNRTNPLYASLTAYQWGANADYNALQVTLKHRSASGLQYQAFYTYSKSIDQKSTIAGGDSRQEVTTILNPVNRAGDRGLSAFDARHNFVFTATYPFPFHFQNKFVGAILGGWAVNGIGTFKTGDPFTGRIGSNTSQDGDRWTPDRPNLIPGFSPNPTSGVTQGCAGITAISNPCQSSLISAACKNVAPGTPVRTQTLWYDPCAFSRPTPGTFGNLGRNTVIGPGLFNTDFSAQKNFKPIERINLQFRAEIFNLFDQAHFYAPAFNVFAGSAGGIGRLIYTPGGRLIQLALKLTF